MIGPEGVAASLAALLRDAIVEEVAVTTAVNGPLMDGTGLPTDDDPDVVDADAIAALVTPRLIVPAPPADISEVQIDDWPFLAIDVRSAPKSAPLPSAGTPPGIDVGNARDYTFEYEARVFTWVRGDGYTQVKAVRDRLMLTVRQVLLRNQQFDVGIRLVEQTLMRVGEGRRRNDHSGTERV